MNLGFGLHHFHLRKRIHKKHEPYPHPNKYKRVMDMFVYFFGIFGPVMTIPQVLQIYVQQNASGISVISWGAYIVNDIFWISYGFMHKDKPIIVMYIAWTVLNCLVVAGALAYG